MTILYLDSSISGISGDMTLGALIDLGADLNEIEARLQEFPIEPFCLEVEGVIKKGIYSKKLHVIQDPDTPPVHHRHYSEIKKMIEESALTPRAKELSFTIFEPIAHAEAKIHHSSIEKVHFHEVGAVDSIVDIVGAAIAIDQLGVEEVYASPVVVGSGSIHIDHGRYPVPAPATLEILKGIPIKHSTVEKELTTPTGAGILKGLATGYSSLPSMTIEKIGYGAGSYDFDTHPNVLRAVLGK
ncbi:LarC family nickel insertion protein [Evansella sp. LMS18]|uniref:LarC family nickel insertion protein n=1 Tax=Evansella sp. LMS18 TaxID=2924033 RepID=UPI0020D1A1DC|nr:LarC family nickel insertion protein [Evansella sp. LMS18]UTR11922.1 LarC family nickel insertion protein [Evansella sp. LMS18]